MFLRSLTIKGFKSFASKTTLEFTPGISVIVGPNGSGKSNVADAVAWVLGEQGPRALRGAQMADVIFAGSPSRPALGMAEVTLVIDNSAGLIPVPAAEIEISRAIYRSGESEYRLGGRPCRLLDIQELLSDTGVGRALHTIIGQGQLEDVLTARPEERRQLIEEAAGIAKHRRRRERAERKLQGMEQDLLRLQDLVGELRRQLRPLKQQAELAERHSALTQEAEDLSRKLAAVRLRELLQERERRAPSWREAQERQEQARRRLAELDAAIADADAEREDAEARLREADEALGAAMESKSAAEAAYRVAFQREGHARERLATASSRSGRLFAVDEELARTAAALEGVEATLRAREDELAAAEEQHAAADAARREAEERHRRAAAQAATARAEREALERTLAETSQESSRLEATIAHLADTRAALAARQDELTAAIESLDAEETPLAAERSRLEAERLQLGESLAGLEATEKGLVAQRERVEARRTEMSESPGTAFAKRRGQAVGVLRDLVDAARDLEPALVAALGPFADAVVYESANQLLLESENAAGTGVTLVAASSDEGPRSMLAERPLAEQVRSDRRVAGLIARLLVDVYLVGNVAEAAAKLRIHPEATFVTPDGTIVGSGFVRTSSGANRRLEQVRREGAAVDRELAGVHRQLREGRARMTEILERQTWLLSRLDEVDAAITAAADELASVRSDLASNAREEHLLSERLRTVAAIAADANERLRALPADEELPDLPSRVEAPVSLRVEVEALRRERTRLAEGVARLREERETLAAEDPVTLREALTAAEAERTAREEALRQAESALAEASTAHRTATDAARAAQQRHAEATRAWRDQAAVVERLRSDHEQEDRARLDLERRVDEAERVLRDGHAMDPAQAVAELQEDDSVDALERRADVVARRLGLLGRVNLLASGELESMQERHDFLVRELEDVRAARRDLMSLIAGIDRTMAEQFAAAFADTAARFTELFAELFPGGEGRLTLADPDDVMGSGIEVEARPGGKRVKRLSLLSGGERSLAALALLFAIFRARPSPFYLMDEVEAALDDVNLSRFLDAMRSFATESQILIVTHQKRTMEMADVLYGISMGNDGSSTVISQRLAEVSVA